MSSQLPVASRRQVRAAALRELRADRRAVVAMVVVNAAACVAGLVAPWLLGRIVDAIHADTGDVLGTVDRLAFAAVLVTVAQIVLTRWALGLGYRFGERTAARIRERFLARTLALPARSADHVPAGDLIARGSTDATAVAATLRSALPEVLTALVYAAFLLAAVFVLDPLLGLCGLVCLLGVGTAVRWYRRRARTAYLEVAAAGADLADVVASTAGGARTVELFGLEQRRAQAADAAIARSRTARLDTLWLRTVLFPWSDVSLVLPVVGVLLAGGALYLHGTISLGVVVTATVYLRQLVGPLDTLMLWIEQFQGAGASYARVEGLASIGVDRDETAGAAEARADPRHTLSRADGESIRLQDASFAYPGGRDVLHGIDLHVRPGERLAIVGASGAGKSTLARLLAGLDRPHRGSVRVGPVPVADLPPEELRARVVLLTQDHHVFHDSLRDNLLLARPDATDRELREAFRAVGAAWIDELPAGLDTVVGTDLHPDGAQAQQLSLARVVLADPQTVILDEATALLDPSTARHTERSLAAVLRGRTVIAIAHRLQTAHDADRVAVLEDGRLVELGSHRVLVGAGGHYGRLWHAWLAGPANR